MWLDAGQDWLGEVFGAEEVKIGPMGLTGLIGLIGPIGGLAISSTRRHAWFFYTSY